MYHDALRITSLIKHRIGEWLGMMTYQKFLSWRSWTISGYYLTKSAENFHQHIFFFRCLQQTLTKYIISPFGKGKIKLFACLTNYALRHKGVWGVDVQIHIFLTSVLVGGEWSASRPCHFNPGERVPGTNWIGGWVDPKPDWTTWRRENSWSYRNSSSDPSVVQLVASRNIYCNIYYNIYMHNDLHWNLAIFPQVDILYLVLTRPARWITQESGCISWAPNVIEKSKALEPVLGHMSPDQIHKI
jgi:hypothetical protein